jgi:hypothetical protein
MQAKRQCPLPPLSSQLPRASAGVVVCADGVAVCADAGAALSPRPGASSWREAVHRRLAVTERRLRLLVVAVVVVMVHRQSSQTTALPRCLLLHLQLVVSSVRAPPRSVLASVPRAVPPLPLCEEAVEMRGGLAGTRKCLP